MVCAGNVHDFVEALAYSAEEMVVMPASFCDREEAERKPRPGAVRNTISWWFKPWFYKHVGAMLHDKRGRRTE